MRASNRRASFGPLADMAILAAFLGLAVLAYGELFLSADEIMTAPASPEFSDVYQPGRNPWISAMIGPASRQDRIASATPARDDDR